MHFLLLIVLISALLSTSAQAQLRIGVTQTPDNWHPLLNETQQSSLLQLIQRPLLRPNASYEWESPLCDQIPTFANNGLRFDTKAKIKHLVSHWTITKDYKWNDGKALTSNDIIFAWTIIQAMADEKIYIHPSLYEFEKIEKLSGSRNIQITHLGVNADFMRTPGIYALPFHIEEPIWNECKKKITCYLQRTKYRAAPSTPGLYSGPFAISRYESASAFIELVRNPHFKNHLAKIESIHVHNVKDAASIERRLSQLDLILPGNLDTVSALALEKRLNSQAESKDRFNFYYPSTDQLEVMAFNIRNPLISDQRIRLAIAAGIDKTKLLTDVFAQTQKPIDDLFSAPWWPTSSKVLFPQTDIQGSKKQLEVLGWDEKEDGSRRMENDLLSIEISTSNDPTRIAIASGILSQLKQIGWSTKLREHRTRDYQDNVLKRAEFRDAALVRWDLGQALNPKAFLHSKEIPSHTNQYQGQNILGFRDIKLSEILEKMESTFEPPVRAALVDQARKILIEQMPFIPLYLVQQPFIARKTINNLRVTDRGVDITGYAEYWQLGLSKK